MYKLAVHIVSFQFISRSVLMVVTHSQETCTRNLYKSTCTRNNLYKKRDRLTWFLIQVSCTEYSTSLFHTRNFLTSMHVTRMVSFDWSAAYRCHCFVVLMLLTICCTKLM